MKNPFIYGEVVKGENFANREKEVIELVRDLKDGQNIFLVSPRRYGKTSLIMRVLEKLENEGFYVVYLDLFRVSSFKGLLEIYTQAISKATETKIESFVKVIREFFPNLRPKVVITPEGPSIEIDYELREKDISQFSEEIYNAPQKIAEKRKKHFVVVFDEFQEMVNLNGEVLEKSMRACFQHHDRVAYLFAGSRRHLVYDMISNRNRAFYGMGKVIKLEKIPRNEFSKFLENKFRKTGFKLETGVINKVLDTVENYPYNAQFLCHELWDNYFDKKKISIEDIKTTLGNILEHQSVGYHTIWNTLSLHQRRLLIGIASTEGKNIFSKDFIRKNELGAVSSIQTSINLLMKKEIIDKEGKNYYITDIFFKKWIEHEMV